MKITNDSHTDHNLTPAIIQYLLTLFAVRDAFFIETVTLPEEFGTVPCGLHGPITGEPPVPETEVYYETRPPRTYTSRLCRRPSIQTRQVTVIAGPHENEACILYTAFGGPLSPKEPGDTTLSPEQRAESEKFWAEHALSLE